MKLLLSFLLLTASLVSFSQTSIWTSNSMKLSADTVPVLEDMSAATTVNLVSPANATALTSFQNNFRFRFGTDTFTTFAASLYGYIKLGAAITGINGDSQDGTIGVFWAYNRFSTLKYKYAGTAPYRQFVVEWSGSFTPTGQQLRLQLVLTETNGKIQMIYSGSNAFTTSNNPYRIYLRQSLYGRYHMANVEIPSGSQTPVANYKTFTNSFSYLNSGTDNYEAVPQRLRLTFQPDTVKPALPSVNYLNVLPGCMQVQPVSDPLHASATVLEKQNADLSYSTLATLEPGQSYYDTALNADTSFKYRVWSVNGFVSSDTALSTKLMPSPLIFGVKKIPGDYPSITALLEDARCKQIGPSLVIELQSNYSFSAEALPVRFTSRYRSKNLAHITIQPAAGAALVLSGHQDYFMFVIDSLNHVEFDGRAGGQGTGRSLTFRTTGVLPAIIYRNAADDGVVSYCNFESTNPNTSGVIKITGTNDFGLLNKPGCDRVTIENCKFGSGSASIPYQVFAEGNFGKGADLLIRDNEFTRFHREAVRIRNLIRPRLIGNSFYQADNFFFTGDGVVSVENCDVEALVEGNRFGGSTNTWGQGSWRNSGEISFIRSTGGLTAKFNLFGNINSSGGRTILIDATGPLVATGNKMGSSDSTGSVVASSHLYGIRNWPTGQSLIESNQIGGFSSGGELYLCNVNDFASASNIVIRNNDFGRSDNYGHNTSQSWTYMVDVYGLNALVKNNVIRGATGKIGGIYGVFCAYNIGTSAICNLNVEGNKIHHLQGRLSVYGVGARVNSSLVNHINNNTFYSLRGTGPSQSPGVSQPAVTCAISASNYSSTPQNSGMEVANNIIHSFDYITPAFAYTYDITGIAVGSARQTSIYNNVLRLGLNASAQTLDTSEVYVTGIAASGPRTVVENNSIYIGGSGGTGISVSASNASLPVKTSFVNNNIIQIDKVRKRRYDDPNIYMSGYAGQSGTNSVVANHNLWYSAQDTGINSALNKWRSYCHCDSNSFIANPLYVNALADSASVDLHVASTSPVNAAGIAPLLPVLYDRDSVLRSDYSPVDIGAYAVVPCNPGTPVQLTLNQSGPVKKCPNTSVSLSAQVSGTPASLNWQFNFMNIPGANGTNLTVIQPGSYRLVATYPCGQATSASIEVIDSLNSFLSPTITASPDINVCANTPVTLTAATPGCLNCTYLWNNGQIGNAITVTGGGDFTVTANSGCGTAVIGQSIYVSPVPPVSITAQKDTVCAGTSTTITASGASIYSWSPPAGLSQTTGAVVTASPTQTTTYTVTGTTNGCSVSKAVTIHVGCLITALPSIDGVEVFDLTPNPNSGLFSIRLKTIRQATVSFEIADNYGKTIEIVKARRVNGSVQQSFNLTRRPGGVYYVKTIINGKARVNKIVVQ